MIPWIESSHTVTPSPVNPLGVKGVGEAGTIGCSPAVVNSVVDALSPLGVRHLDMPLTPEKNLENSVRRRPVMKIVAHALVRATSRLVSTPFAGGQS